MQRIPFQTPLVRAFLARRKRETRRVMAPQPPEDWQPGEIIKSDPALGPDGGMDNRPSGEWSDCGDPMNDVWKVRYKTGETVAMGEALVRKIDLIGYPHGYVSRSADSTVVRGPSTAPRPWEWKRDKHPSVFMPLWAARRFFRVVRAWPHRLHDMSCEDILAEGIEDPGAGGRGYGWREMRLRHLWRRLWDSINAKPQPMRRSKRPLKRPRKPSYPWASNPWVFAYKLKEVEKPLTDRSADRADDADDGEEATDG